VIGLADRAGTTAKYGSGTFSRPAAPADEPENERQHKYRDKNIEQDLGDACRRAGYPAESQNCRDDRDYQEC
jgi:hypothetical protein